MTLAEKTATKLLTRERLVTSRWVWGQQNRPPLTNSFYFGDDGRIKVYLHENERSWTLNDDGILRIYHEAGHLIWAFETIIETGDGITLLGRPQHSPDWDITFSLSEYRATTKIAPDAIDLAADGAPEGGGDDQGGEGVRLVIWDLDDTFWQGTLSEGGITPIQTHLDLIDQLNQRGIVNAICSKNDHGEAEKQLRALGVWDKFVFPEISWSPKGAMVKNIIRNAQLRPASVLFIDDNQLNLNEAKFYVPDLQIADPGIIPGLLNDPRFAGKPDPKLSRLARYRILQSKLAEKANFKGDNENFLRESQIKISFHADVEAEFARVHDLVNRTNQLNFTKNRWPENIDEARLQFHREVEADFYTNCGYVKVADRYGQYGICGFYLISKDVCQHLLFSCRAMNMGVEQFVWTKLGRPFVPVQGTVISDIDMQVDWIEVVEDAEKLGDAPDHEAIKKLTVCIRGGCDMTMMSNFLKTRVNTIEELNYAYQGWEISTQPRLVALHDELQRPENQAIIAQMPGLPPLRFKTDLVTGSADIYVLSFSQESFHGLYRAKSTGLAFPMGHFGLGHHMVEKMDYTKLSYQDILDRGVKGVSQAQWEFLTSEFEFLGGYNEAIFKADARKILTDLRARNKQVIIVGLNSQVGQDKPILNFFANINAIIEPMAAELGCDYIDVNTLIHTHDDLAKDGRFGGPHFARHVYVKIAEEVLARIQGEVG